MHFDVEVIDVSVSSLPKHRKSMMCLFPHGVRDNDLLQGMKCCTGETEDLNQGMVLIFSPHNLTIYCVGEENDHLCWFFFQILPNLHNLYGRCSLRYGGSAGRVSACQSVYTGFKSRPA